MNIADKVRRSIFKRLPLAAACALAIFLTGCDPEEIIQWSPDGKHALVRSADTTRVVDASGAIIGEAPGTQVWMPDSRRAIGVRVVKPCDWNEYAALLGKVRADAVARAAEEMLPIIRDYKGEWSKFGEAEAVKQWDADHSKLPRMPAIYFLSEKHADDIAPALKAWREESKDDGSVAVPIFELLIRNALPGEPPAERVLTRSADAIDSLCVAPNGRMIAFVLDKPERRALYVIATDGGDPQFVDEGATQADWTPDGRQLAYAKTTAAFDGAESEMLVGTITRRSVCDEKGLTLAKPGDPEDLAGILFSAGKNRVACLPDGRILFSSTAIKLPALSGDMPKSLTLFTLRPGKTPSIKRVVSEQSQKKLPARADRFVLSSDAKRVAIPGDNGEVAVLTLATGEVTPVQGKIADFGNGESFANKQKPSPVAPCWRGANELCYVVPAGDKSGSPKRAEVVLRLPDGKPRAISKSWSDAMTDTFLPRPK